MFVNFCDMLAELSAWYLSYTGLIEVPIPPSSKLLFSVGISMKTGSCDVVHVSNFKLNMDKQANSTRRRPHHSK